MYIRPDARCSGCEIGNVTLEQVLPFSGPVTVRYRLHSTGTGPIRFSLHTGVVVITRANTSSFAEGVMPQRRTRCDVVIVRTEGCVNYAQVPTFFLPGGSTKPWAAVAAHIQFVQATLPDRWGHRAGGGMLHRWKTDRTTVKRHRAYACYKLVKPPGTECDEFPFASTHENGGFLRDRSRFSVWAVPREDNNAAGQELRRFYSTKRILDGEAFWVDPS
jgi:hypothetical protein